MVITASGSTDFQTTWWISSASDTTYREPITIDWSQFACGLFETEHDYKSFVTELHLEEDRKDVFRQTSIIPKTTEHTQRVINQKIPGKRNFKGNQASRF